MILQTKKIAGKWQQTGLFSNGKPDGICFETDNIQILFGDYVVDEFELDANGKPIGIKSLKETPIVAERKARGVRI